MDKYEERRIALKTLRDRIGYGAIRVIAEKIGKDSSYVSRMLYPSTKRGYKRIGEDSVEELDRAFPGWLENEKSNIPDIASSKSASSVNIPKYDVAGSMGNGLELHDQPGVLENLQVSKEWLSQNLRSYTSAKNLCLVTGFGDSMVPMFNPGDPLIVDIGINVVDHDAVFFFRIGNEGYIKRLQRIPTENGLVIRAISENRKAYEPFDITEGMDFHVIGKILIAWNRQEF